MYTSIHIDENEIKQICHRKKKRTELKCKCDYFTYLDILLKYTPLPKVLANLIYEWTSDDIIIQIHEIYNDYEFSKKIEFTSSTCINFIDVQFQFMIDIDLYRKTCKVQVRDIQCNDNILKCSAANTYTMMHGIDNLRKSICTKKMYEHTIETLKEFKNVKKIKKILFLKTLFAVEILNYELWLIFCSIVSRLCQMF